MKNELFQRRIERLGKGPLLDVWKWCERLGQKLWQWAKVVYAKATALERHYHRLQKEQQAGVTGSLEVRQELRREAEELFEKEAYTAAEQRLIELVSLDPRQAETYELLGRVYLATRQFDQAKETFKYAHTIAPKDASITVSLGELAMRDGNAKGAVVLFNEAVDLRPGNPKYLDYLIEASVLSGDRMHAKKGLEFLKEVNPDNQKIAEFEARVAEME